MVPVFQAAERIAGDRLIELALAEDLGEAGDITSQALVGPDQRAKLQVVARQAGVLAGGPVAEMVFRKLDPAVKWNANVADGSRIKAGTVVAEVSGPARSVLSGERTALNSLCHLSGIATLTRQYVEAVAGTGARIFDTRKTLPGWRILEKYAVRCGGGTNHRMGLYDGVLIKDNHLAAWTLGLSGSLGEAVRAVRTAVPADVPVEIEVDTLKQLKEALGAAPDVILLDNMDISTLRASVSLRNRLSPGTELEASGGISLDTVREIAETGVERISVGALTHSAVALDLAFDWTRDDA